MLDLARRHGDVRVQLAFIDEHGPLDAVVTAAATMTGLRLVSGNIAMHWEESTVAGTLRVVVGLKHLISRFECSCPSCVCAARELGVQQGLIIAERERLSAEYAIAIADLQNRNAELHSLVEEADNDLSARESNIAVAGGLLAERECALAGRKQQLEANRAQPQERECQLGLANAQLHEREARINAIEAQQAAREAERAGWEEAPTSRRDPTDGSVTHHNTAESGFTTQTYRTQRLIAGGAPLRTAQRSPADERRQAVPQTSQGNYGKPRFHPFVPLPSRTSPLDDHSGTEEEELRFCAFDVTTRPSCVGNEGVSGVVVDLRGAYSYWQQADDQNKLSFDCLVAWIGALEAERDLSDRFTNLFGTLLQAFRMQLMMASKTDIPLLKIRSRLYAAVHEADTFARAAQMLLERRGTQRPVRCQLCHIYGHDASKCNLRGAPRRNRLQYRRPSKNGKGAARCL
ncbi:hypothetical protein TcCL_Unassigned02779 [Trypanosoma cruzi]|nr:hypothetical protein TcCL_Unassigned02779 [Trypanosoma cruzi]